MHPPYTHISKIYFLLLVLDLEPLTPTLSTLGLSETQNQKCSTWGLLTFNETLFLVVFVQPAKANNNN